MSGLVANVAYAVSNTDTNIQSVLLHNPGVADEDLRGAIKCNLIGFKGRVSVETKPYKFATGNKEARVIYITSYAWGADGLISLKRLLAGVKFQEHAGPLDEKEERDNRITKYVLGVLRHSDSSYEIAKQEADAAFKEGRRLTIAVTSNDFALSFESNADGLCTII